jgi:putative ABC transport system substrate-binding protein
MRADPAALLLAAAAGAFAAAVTAGAPSAPAAERPRVGVLFWHDSPNDREAFEGVRDGFALAGLDPIFEVVEARGDDAAARKALRDFESRGDALVYALGTGAALRARAEVRKVPVVFTAVTDPVGSGVVDAAGGSGANLCGNSSGVDPAAALAVFRSALPSLATLAVVYDPANPVSRGEVETMRKAAGALRPPVRLAVRETPAVELRKPGGVREACAAALAGADALWVPIDIEVYSRADQAAEAAAAARRPVFSTAAAAARTAACVCLTADFRAVGRSSVVLAVGALRGGDPGRMPVGRPRSHRVVLNLEAAARAGFEIPLAVIAWADEFAGVAGGR